MTAFAVLRHGPTAWNAAGSLQGRQDLPLTPGARAALERRRLPAEVAGFAWLASPLRRAQETAAALGITALPELRLVEMAWGDWEGRTLAELRRSPEARLAEREAAGLDLAPPGGESPRAVQRRLMPLLAEIAARGAPVGAVTHKGIIRALLALASGWDMRGKPPVRLDWERVQLFELDGTGRPRLVRCNLALLDRETG